MDWAIRQGKTLDPSAQRAGSHGDLRRGDRSGVPAVSSYLDAVGLLPLEMPKGVHACVQNANDQNVVPILGVEDDVRAVFEAP